MGSTIAYTSAEPPTEPAAHSSHPDPARASEPDAGRPSGDGASQRASQTYASDEQQLVRGHRARSAELIAALDSATERPAVRHEER